MIAGDLRKTQSGQPPGLLFDLDGTLVDSAPDLAAALDAALADAGMPPAGLDATRRWVGGGARLLIERALTARRGHAPADAAIEAMLERFLHHYREHNGLEARLYPGIDALLKWLSTTGHRLACVTNKPQDFIAPLLRKLGVDRLFDTCVGGDTLAERKPHALPLLHAATTLGVPPANCIMIGDSRTDADAARNAGMPFVWVSYGYHRGDTAQTLRPAATAASAAQLHAILECC